jgi:hypothetical protein
MAPGWASFYVLTPIPGTEQYDDFMADGWITEPNLDRYDGCHLNWRHPNMSGAHLMRLLFQCYRGFYSLPQALANLRRVRARGRQGIAAAAAENVGMSLFNRYCAWRQMHPMSGGIGRVRLDGVRDFIELRRRVFDFDLAPLPRSLPLPPEEDRLNRLVNPRVRGKLLPA